jgi:hypothetical protein
MRISLVVTNVFCLNLRKRKQIYSPVHETPQSNGNLIANKNKNEALGCVAVPDSGYSASLTPGFGIQIRDGKKIRIRDEHHR